MSSKAYNHWGWIILVVTCTANILLILYFMFIQVPVDLEEEQEIEGAALLVAADISQVEDYWMSSDLMVQKGKELYGQYCALCHGPTGKGDGVAGRGLNPPPRNLKKGNWKYGGRSKDIFKVVTNGSEGTSMASFSHIPKKERWALVHFVRSLSKKKRKDDLEDLKNFAIQAQ